MNVNQVSSGWSHVVPTLNSSGGVLAFDVNRSASRGDLMPALARLCLRIARRRAAKNATQTSEPAGVPSAELKPI